MRLRGYWRRASSSRKAPSPRGGALELCVSYPPPCVTYHARPNHITNTFEPGRVDPVEFANHEAVVVRILRVRASRRDVGRVARRPDGAARRQTCSAGEACRTLARRGRA